MCSENTDRKPPCDLEKIGRPGKPPSAGLHYVGRGENCLEDPNNGVAYVVFQFSPFELREEFFRIRLSRYGIVLNSRRNKIPETEVFNGLITVRMILKQHIPSFIQVGGYSVMCCYPGQPRTCLRCDSMDHVAAYCNVYQCFNCSEPSHSSSACQEPSKCFLCDVEDY